MASENVQNWDLPLPIPENISEESTYELTQDNLELECYVESMVYRQVEPIKASQITEILSKPKQRMLTNNVEQFNEFLVATERAERLKRSANKHNTITAEQLEQEIHYAKTKERRKEKILKQQEEIYYELLTKVELQCRIQYLDYIFKKFADFIAKLSTTMCIPAILFDPYARMQRAIFCKILQSIAVKPISQTAINYNTEESHGYAVYHKLAHALVNIMIKALDLATTIIPENEDTQLQPNTKMDNDIKNRLMRGAKKKVQNVKEKKM